MGIGGGKTEAERTDKHGQNKATKWYAAGAVAFDFEVDLLLPDKFN